MCVLILLYSISRFLSKTNQRLRDSVPPPLSLKTTGPTWNWTYQLDGGLKPPHPYMSYILGLVIALQFYWQLALFSYSVAAVNRHKLTLNAGTDRPLPPIHAHTAPLVTPASAGSLFLYRAACPWFFCIGVYISEWLVGTSALREYPSAAAAVLRLSTFRCWLVAWSLRHSPSLLLPRFSVSFVCCLEHWEHHVDFRATAAVLSAPCHVCAHEFRLAVDCR